VWFYLASRAERKVREDLNRQLESEYGFLAFEFESVVTIFSISRSLIISEPYNLAEKSTTLACGHSSKARRYIVGDAITIYYRSMLEEEVYMRLWLI